MKIVTKQCIGSIYHSRHLGVERFEKPVICLLFMEKRFEKFKYGLKNLLLEGVVQWILKVLFCMLEGYYGRRNMICNISYKNHQTLTMLPTHFKPD